MYTLDEVLVLSNLLIKGVKGLRSRNNNFEHYLSVAICMARERIS